MNTTQKKHGSTNPEYEELFGTPALDPEPEEEAPPDPPPIHGVSKATREAFRRLWPVAYRHHESLMEVMTGVRKALKRGHDAADAAGGPSR